MGVRGIDSVSFYGFSIGLCNCFDNVVFLFFILLYQYFALLSNQLINDKVLLTVGCPIFPPFYIDSKISVHRKLKKIDQLIFRNAKEIYFNETVESDRIDTPNTHGMITHFPCLA
jgi:hypothetical protein